jgi:hypothetical protein
VTLSYRVNGGAVQSVALGGPSPGAWYGPAGSKTARAVLGPFMPRAAGDLEIWLHATDGAGCEAWDSNFGHNHHFAIHDARTGQITFDSVRGRAATHGRLPSGGTVEVRYSGARVPGCRRNIQEGQHLVAMHYRFDGHGAWGDRVVNDVFGAGFGQLEVPVGAHHLELWFEAFDHGSGCHDYDSRDGQNYVMGLE